MKMNSLVDAYIDMAESLKYRPEAPGDGFGGIFLTRKELKDYQILEDEARRYAARFTAEEKTLSFHIGVGDGRTMQALAYTIEAARCICSGSPGNQMAIKLMRMAINYIDHELKAHRI